MIAGQSYEQGLDSQHGWSIVVLVVRASGFSATRSARASAPQLGENQVGLPTITYSETGTRNAGARLR